MIDAASPPTALARRERRLWASLALLVALILSTIWTSGAFPAPALPYLFAIFGLALVAVTGLIARGGARDDRALAIAFALALAFLVLMMPLRLVSTAERSHLIEYCAVAVLLREALRVRGMRGRAVARPGLVTLVAVVLVGLVDEVLQETVATRHFDWRDIVVDACAAVLGLVFYRLGRIVARRWRSRRSARKMVAEEGLEPPTRGL